MMHVFLNDLLATCQSLPEKVLIVNDNAKMEVASRSRCCQPQASGRDRRRDRWHSVRRQASDSCLVRPKRQSSKDSQELLSTSEHSVLPARFRGSPPAPPTANTQPRRLQRPTCTCPNQALSMPTRRSSPTLRLSKPSNLLSQLDDSTHLKRMERFEKTTAGGHRQ